MIKTSSPFVMNFGREHHHFPNKHTAAHNKIKYIRKKINEGVLEEWKNVMFMEIAEMRDMEEHTGGKDAKNRNLTI